MSWFTDLRDKVESSIMGGSPAAPATPTANGTAIQMSTSTHGITFILIVVAVIIGVFFLFKKGKL